MIQFKSLNEPEKNQTLLRSHGELPSFSSDIYRERPPPSSQCPSLTWSRSPSLPNSLNKVKESISAWRCTWAICTPCDSHVTHTLPSTLARCGADTFSCNDNVTVQRCATVHFLVNCKVPLEHCEIALFGANKQHTFRDQSQHFEMCSAY